MDILHNLAIGFAAAATPTNLLFCFLGCLLGTAIGVLPGLGPASTIAMLLPVTFTLEPTTSLIMLAGIYYGAQYGGSTTAILVNLPGEATSVVTALDGHQMARKGKAGQALAVAAVGSFIGGSVATLLIGMFAPALAYAALKFGAPEYFSLMTLGLIASIVLAHGSIVKALGMLLIGLILGIVGIDTTSGDYRMTLGFIELSDGVSIVAVAMGLFGIGDIIQTLGEKPDERRTFSLSFKSMFPSLQEWRMAFGPIVRGTAIGSVLGILPGGGALLSSFASYAIEKKVAKDPTRFGKGAIEGVAGPETANNAGAQTSFIPMLTLGIPSNVIMALMIGALLIQGIQPGPAVIKEQPQLFWGLVVSMWIGNLMLLILNLPLIGVWVKLLSMPYRLLFPAIMLFCSIGVLTINNNVFDLYVMVLFGLAGYAFLKLGCEPAPLLLGMVLGPMMESYLRRSMLLSRGDPMIFLERPLSAILLVAAFLALVAVLLPSVRRKRDEAMAE